MMTEIPAVRGFIRMCTDGWEQGWHERNGGNLTYRMKPEEVEQCRPFFTAPREWNSMGVQAFFSTPPRPPCFRAERPRRHTAPPSRPAAR